MLRPHIPTNPTPIHTTAAPLVRPSTHQQDIPAPACGCHHAPAPVAPQPVIRRSVQLTPAALVTGTAVALVVGTVLVSLLLAVAVTAASVAVCSVVLALLVRWLRAQSPHR